MHYIDRQTLCYEIIKKDKTDNDILYMEIQCNFIERYIQIEKERQIEREKERDREREREKEREKEREIDRQREREREEERE